MDGLRDNWITEGLIDFEYKKYLLLAYLKQVRDRFGLNKLYPDLSDLIFHYQNLQQIKNNKEVLESAFPKKLTKADFENLKLTYKKIIEDDEVIKEIYDIANFGMENIKSCIEEGKTIYEWIEECISVEPIGLLPIYKKEGYFMLTEQKSRGCKVYRYNVSVFNSDEVYRGISTTQMGNFTWSITNTYEQIKKEVVKKNNDLPTPAFYVFNCKIAVPEQETYLPLVKRILLKHID